MDRQYPRRNGPRGGVLPGVRPGSFGRQPPTSDSLSHHAGCTRYHWTSDEGYCYSHYERVYHEGGILDVLALQNELSVSPAELREAAKVLTAKGRLGARQKRGHSSGHGRTGYCSTRWRVASSAIVEFLANVAEVRMMVEHGAATALSY